MKFGSMKPPSKYLAKEDADPAKLVTIARFAVEQMENRGKTENKFIVYFQEHQKGMVLNSTNRKLMQMAFGLTDDDDADLAIGKKIVIWNDPSVQDLQGDLVGGIRFRKYNPKPGKAAEPAPPSEPAFDDDIPF